MSESPQIKVTNNITNPQAHGWTVLALLLGGGVVGLTLWRLSLSGYLELASSVGAAFVMALGRGLFAAGIVRVPESRGPQEFAQTRGLLRTAYDEARDWKQRGGIPAIVGGAVLSTLAFIVLKLATNALLHAVTGMWQLIILGMAVSVAIVAPHKVRDWWHTLGAASRNARAAAERRAADQPAPQRAYPVAEGRDTPAAPPTVMRLIKDDNQDEGERKHG